jgi:formylglycine-generating enzyme required for sulfatase activity
MRRWLYWLLAALSIHACAVYIPTDVCITAADCASGQVCTDSGLCGEAESSEPFDPLRLARPNGGTFLAWTRPGPVAGVSASQGTNAEFVLVSWQATPGAFAYRISRDGAVIGETGQTRFSDVAATSGGAPEPPGDLIASMGDYDDAVRLRWNAAAVTPGARHRYSVQAVGALGAGTPSDEVTGFRSGPRVSGYLLDVSDDRLIELTATNEYVDFLAPEGVLDIDYIVASSGLHVGEIHASFVGLQKAAGESLVYSLRAVNEVGESDESRARGWRSEPRPLLRWIADAVVDAGSRDTVLGEGWDAIVLPAEPGVFTEVCAVLYASDVGSESERWCSVGWAADCATDEACSDGDHCAGGLCAPLGVVRLPAGIVRLGTSSLSEYERERHALNFTGDFSHDRLYAQFEVTQADWFALFGSAPSTFAQCGPSCPVESITWGSALFYANALSERDGLELCYDLSSCVGDGPDGSLVCDSNPPLRGGHTSAYDCLGWRLPTEFEWEFASKYRSDAPEFAWMNAPFDATCGDDPGAFGEYARTCFSSAVDWSGCDTAVPEVPCSGPAPVGGLRASPRGIYDAVGNVAEFVWARRTPQLFWDMHVYDPEEFTATGDVGVRGGSYRDRPFDARTAKRRWVSPTYRGGDVGFRLVRVVGAAD